MRGTLEKLVLAALLLAGCGTTVVYLDDGCIPGEYTCDEDVLYRCLELDNGYVSWETLAECAYGCGDGMCLQYENTCHLQALDENAHIKKDESEYYEIDGTCRCADACPDECDESGACLCDFYCPFGCEDGECACEESCLYGCDELGYCACSDSCPNDCDPRTGECIPEYAHFVVNPDPIVLSSTVRSTPVSVRYMVNGKLKRNAEILFGLEKADCVDVAQESPRSGRFTVSLISSTSCMDLLTLQVTEGEQKTTQRVAIVFIAEEKE